jgi:ferredoxin-nitrate reductase
MIRPQGEPSPVGAVSGSLESHESRNSIADIWGARTPYDGEWPTRVDEATVDRPDHWVQSACVLCSVGCALDIGVKANRIVGVRGRAVDRANRGRLGPKGLHGWQANHHPDRLTRPLVRRNGRLIPVSWDEAMDLVVARSRAVKAEHGGGGIGIYNSGQLFLEEYYTLSLIGDAGLGTPHMDGSTRLCTATAALALIESFGSDGNPGSYRDLDVTDAILHIGHNVAETQTVLWSRILDRRRGPRPPVLLVIDPRRTITAAEADVHLAPRLGTNLPLLNGLLHLVIANGRLDRSFIDAHTVGFEALQDVVAKWTPDRVAEITGIATRQLHEAAAILGHVDTLVSTVLQGVYQSMQATATAVQVNNLHLIRGLIGKPGATVFQMNGQPTAQNTRECGANGELVALRNWRNPAHVAELARAWNVDPRTLPTWGPPTHAMQIFRYAEEGSIRLLWVIGTNPAVSLPDLARIRRILAQESLFLIVQDAFMTETAQFADVVLPTALWGEKTGCFTNPDRTVHLSYRAVDPPGEARSDLDILLDYARRMDFRDKDGAPLVKWTDPEGAFDGWRACSRGRPSDYSGLSYAKLSQGSGIQWPCTERDPDGRERLYENGVFTTGAEDCELYGHDLTTGAEITPALYRAHDPRGRAVIKPADWIPPSEEPDSAYPFWLTTGRVVYHWHTRTKTGRVPALQAAAPEPWVQLTAEDAARLEIREGEAVLVGTRRGHVRVAAQIGEGLLGHLFMPFHYGSWDDPTRHGAANELTLTGWDPVSKQPHFKFAAAWIRRA